MIEKVRVRDVEQMCEYVLLSLAVCTAELRPGSKLKDFSRDVVYNVTEYDNSAVVDPLEIVMQFIPPELRAKGVDWVAQQAFAPIFISATYCVRAQTNSVEGCKDLAWANTADAMFWCGVASAGRGISKIAAKSRAEGEAKVLSETAKSGGTARSDGWQPLREFAFARARRSEMKWASRSHAAEVIAKATFEFREEKMALAASMETEIKIAKQSAREAGMPYQGDVKVTRLPKIKLKSFVRTVDTWLKEMPDAASLFPSARTPK